jgi:hypothetical protein
MQSEENDLGPADRELEAALKSLAPSRNDRIDPISAAFSAGRTTARRQVHFWRSTSVALLLSTMGSWMIPFGGRTNVAPTVVATVPDPIVTIASTSPATFAAPPAGHSLLMLQNAVRDRGVDGLPATELPTIRNFRVADFF